MSWTPGPWHQYRGQIRGGDPDPDLCSSLMIIYRSSGGFAGNAGLNFGDRPEPVFYRPEDAKLAALAPEMAEAILEHYDKKQMDIAPCEFCQIGERLRTIRDGEA